MKLQATSYKLQANRGFTLTEVIVVIAITAVLASLLLANTRGPSRKFEVRRGVQQMISDLRKTQALAISSQTVTCGASVTSPNYGFRTQVNSSGNASYAIFADCDKNISYNTSGDDFILNTVTLENVFVKLTSPASGGSTYLEVVYIPPIPDVAINASTFTYPSQVGEFIIEVCSLSETTLCTRIRGNSRGNIEIQ